MASGDSLIIFRANDNEPPDANAATPDRRNARSVLDFDATTEEYAIFTGVLPRNYGGGGITAYIHYACTSATSGTMHWLLQFERIGDSQLDIDSDSFASAESNSGTVPGTSGHVDIISIPFANGAEIDSIAVGELFRIKVIRDVGNDDVSGDVELLAVELKET